MDIYIYPGWWLTKTPLKNDGQLISWDYDIPIWKNEKSSSHVPVTTNQRMYPPYTNQHTPSFGRYHQTPPGQAPALGQR